MKLKDKFNAKAILKAKRTLVEENEAEIKFCNICGTQETKQWYADPVDPGFMCKTHYRKLIYVLNQSTEKDRAKEYYEQNREEVIERVVANKKKKKAES